MQYVLYIIYSQKLDRYYVGHTESIEQRIIQHNNGVSTYTSKSNDWMLVYKEIFDVREAAFKREREIKRKKSRKYIEWLISSAD